MVRPKLEENVTRFQHRKPSLGRVVGNAAIRRQRGIIQQLAAPAGAEAHEALEGLQVLNLKHLSDVPLDISGNIGAKPSPDGDVAVIERRIAAGEKHPVERCRRPAGLLQLVQRKGEQFYKGGSSGQGLGYIGQEAEPLRAGEEKEAHAAVEIDPGLEIGEDFRTALHLIQNGAIGKAAEKGAGILPGRQPHIRFLQRHVRLVGENGLGERCFSGLARSRNGYDRKSLQ